MDIHNYLNLVVDNQYNVGSVFGQYGHQLSRGDMMFMEYILANNEQKYTTVVELGTAIGLTSLYLGVSMKLRNGKLYTFDNIDHRSNGVKLLWQDNMTQHIADVLSSPNNDVIELMGIDNTLAFIDNGDKKKEVNMYAPFIKNKSGLLVHDWNTEVFEHEISETLIKYNFKRQYEDIGNMLHSHLAFWIKNDEA